MKIIFFRLAHFELFHELFQYFLAFGTFLEHLRDYGILLFGLFSFQFWEAIEYFGEHLIVLAIITVLNWNDRVLFSISVFQIEFFRLRLLFFVVWVVGVVCTVEIFFSEPDEEIFNFPFLLFSFTASYTYFCCRRYTSKADGWYWVARCFAWSKFSRCFPTDFASFLLSSYLGSESTRGSPLRPQFCCVAEPMDLKFSSLSDTKVQADPFWNSDAWTQSEWNPSSFCESHTCLTNYAVNTCLTNDARLLCLKKRGSTLS